MRHVEDRARPVLVPLLLGDATRLQPHDQAIIATWAIMKVMVSEYSRNGHVTVHWTQRRRMRTRRSPPEKGWGVWLGHYERQNWKGGWNSQAFFIASDAVVARRGLREPTYYNSSSVTLVVGKLFIQIIHAPMPELIERYKFPPLRGTLLPIWPLSSFSIVWPQRTLSDRDADNISDAIHQCLREIATAQ
jgi:hypothetical protein